MATHLNIEERERIAQMWFAGDARKRIAEVLKRHPSTISRELRRNADSLNGYLASRAQRRAEARRRDRPWVRKMQRPPLNEFVRRGLTQRWSPDQIAGRSRLEFRHDRKQQVSRQTIYDWIGQHPRRRHWESRLRRRGKVKRPLELRGQIPHQVRIDGRPAIVDRRTRFGDWEGDTMIGHRRQGVVLTLVERKSGYLLAAKANDRRATPIRRQIERRLAHWPAALRRTMTFDNGKEFSEHQLLTQHTGLAVYFSHPYCSWERGTIENTNGLLRQYLPRRMNFLTLAPATVRRAVHSLNHRPRRRLEYRTPHEVLHQDSSIAFET
jgi:transposase, IS30 family